jgi:hypothetical protein
MPAYEKADFYAAYGTYPHVPGTNLRLARHYNPDLFGEGNFVTCRLHYHPHTIKPEKVALAQRLVDHFNDIGDPLLGTDKILIVGGAFGWLGEALEDLVPGLYHITCDLSTYVQDNKDLSPDDELIESINAEGLDETAGIGLQLFNWFSDLNPRSRQGSRVLQEDLSTNQSRNRVRQAFNNQPPDRAITEETWQVLSPAEQADYINAFTTWNIPYTHIIDNVIVEGV